MTRELKDQVIIITGASAGIGAATAWACARAGMRVVLAARRGEVIDQLARDMQAANLQAIACPCDVARDDDVRRLVAFTLDKLGRIDAIFANAGYGLFASVLDSTDAQARAIFEVNYFGTIRLIQAAVPHMLQQGRGHVILCASAASELGLPMYGHYSATKAAQDAIASALRAELAGSGVQVSSVHPVGTRTEFWQVAAKLADKQDVGLNTPRMLMQSPDRVARAIVRCLRRPCPEVWPSVPARFGLALTTAFPRLGAFAMRRLMRRRRKITGERR
jgi:short-subunit dehydrogenase